MIRADKPTERSGRIVCDPSQPSCPSTLPCPARPAPPAGQGSCARARSPCSAFADDSEGCAAQKQCRAAPRCQTSYCDRGNQCCRAHTPAACAATAGCRAAGRCSLQFSRCWGPANATACAAAAGCGWRAYASGGGYCSPLSEPCRAAALDASPAACAAVLDPELNISVCQYNVRTRAGGEKGLCPRNWVPVEWLCRQAKHAQ